jgi:hypothetical protein
MSHYTRPGRQVKVHAPDSIECIRDVDMGPKYDCAVAWTKCLGQRRRIRRKTVETLTVPWISIRLGPRWDD